MANGPPEPISKPQIRMISGNDQTAVIGEEVPDPLVVELVDASGTPVSNKTVIFKVVENNGQIVAPGSLGNATAIQTDGQGRAEVRWKLGSRAGAGNNVVQAAAVSFEGVVIFTATAIHGTPGQINLDSGNNQYGVAGQQLPRPFVAVVTDAGFNRLRDVPVTFTVTAGNGDFNGQSSITSITDTDGRSVAILTLGPEEGIENNLVEANFPGNTGLPTTFVSSGKIAGDPAQTRISGVVLDNTNIPIEGVTVRIDETNITTQTDDQGQFVIQPAPIGHVDLFVDGSTANRPGSWPTLEYEMTTVSGKDNTVNMPIYLLPIDLPRGIYIDETTGGTLTLDDVPGFSLTIAPGSATFPDGGKKGVVSVTVVHMDKVPMTPNFGQQPRFIVTIQPAGVRFEPPAPMTIPNLDGKAPGQITELYSFDHDLGSFVAIGTGHVSDDGTMIMSDPGVGIIKGGWHCGGDPTDTSEATRLYITLMDVGILKPGEIIMIEADGHPDRRIRYEWKIVKDDPSEDTSVARMVTTPSCIDQDKCIAKLEALKAGMATIEVTLHCTAPNQTDRHVIAKKKVKVVPGHWIEEVTFVNGFEISHDDGTLYTIPHWKDNDKDNNASDPGENRFPVAYARQSLVYLIAKFRLDSVVNANDVRVKGLGPDGLEFESIVNIAGTSFETPIMISSKTLPNVVRYYNPFFIKWELTINGETIPAGVTDNRMYVTMDSPAGVTAYETLLDIGCRNANGQSAVSGIVDNIWIDFKDLVVHRKERDGYNEQDGLVMTYWVNENDPRLPDVSQQCQTFQNMINPNAQLTGIGTCVAWSRLFSNILRVQGITDTEVFVITANTITNTEANGFLVKKWSFDEHIWEGSDRDCDTKTPKVDDVKQGGMDLNLWCITPGRNGKLDTPVESGDEKQLGLFFGEKFPFALFKGIIGDVSSYGNDFGDFSNQQGVEGQGKIFEPPEFFSNHYIVKANGKFYDPSYGMGPFSTKEEHTQQAMDGIKARLGLIGIDRAKVIDDPTTEFVYCPFGAVCTN